MIETGFNHTEIRLQIILAACFISDLGTVCSALKHRFTPRYADRTACYSGQ